MANTHCRRAGPIALTAVGHKHDVLVDDRTDCLFQRVGSHCGQNRTECCATTVGGNQNRHLFARQAALAGLAAPFAGLASQFALSLMALQNIGFIDLDDPFEFLRGLPCGLQKPVSPTKGRVDSKVTVSR